MSNSILNNNAGLGGNQDTEERLYGTSGQNGIPEESGGHHQGRIDVPALNDHAHVIPQRVSNSGIELSRGTKRRRGAHSPTRQQRTDQVLPTVLHCEPSSSRVNDSGIVHISSSDPLVTHATRSVITAMFLLIIYACQVARMVITWMLGTGN